MKMAVLVHIRTEPRRAALQLHLPREAGFHERIEAVVNRGVGDFRHRLLGADENLLGGRMVALVEQHVINLLPLRRQTQAGGAQLFGQVPFFVRMAARFHAGKNLAQGAPQVKI